MATSPILRPSPATLRRRPTGAKQTSLTLFPPAARHGNCEPPSGASAPPPVPDRRTKPATELVGIARLAASSPRAEAKRGTEYFLLPVKSILNECHSERVPFRWTVNPYRGCEFGCKYCYARYTHGYMELEASDFESKIYVKKDAGPLAERDLGHEKIWGEHIAIGSGDRPLSAGRARVRRDAGDPGENGGAGRVERLDHHEIGSSGARYRSAAEDFGALVAYRQFDASRRCERIWRDCWNRERRGQICAWQPFAGCARREFPQVCSPCRSCPG